jgi:RNA polymerase sigma-70 factor (ECF subfamily)
MTLFRKNYSKLSDEELMSLLAKGGQSAFDELYKRYAQPMLHFFFRLLNADRERAEDMVHDLFLKIIEQPHSFDATRPFRTWFYSLAANMVRNEYRSRQVRNEHAAYVGHQPEPLEFLKDDMDRQLFDHRLQTELSRLDSDAQLIFKLRFGEEMSVKQIAEIINCPEGTIKSRLFYITKQLGTKLAIYKPN